MGERFVGFFATICFFFLLSCGKNPKLVEELIQAERLMATNPDSAKTILVSLPAPEQMSRADYALYCLLLTEVQDKTYYEFTSDSTIQIALDYYETTNDRRRLPEAYYFMGRVCQTMRNAPGAVNYYLKAKDALPDGSDLALEARIYNMLGGVYVLLRFNENAATAYQKAHELLSLTRDSVNLSYVLRNIARVYQAAEKSDSAIIYYTNAIDVAAEVNNPYCERSARMELAGLYLKDGKPAEAKAHIEKALEQSEGVSEKPQTLLILGDYYNAIGKADSSRYYFNRSRNTTNIHTNAASIRELGLLEEKEKNYQAMARYYHQYMVCKDSIEKIESKSAISDMENFYNYQQVESENNRLKTKNIQKEIFHTKLYFSIALFMLFLVVFFQAYRLRKKKEMADKEETIRNDRMKIEKNSHEIQQLNAMLEKQRGILNRVPEEFVREMKDSLELENRGIEASMHRADLQRKRLLESDGYKELKNMRPNVLLSQGAWERFKDDLDAIYVSFENRLIQLHPQITPVEKKICYLVKSEFSVTEIACLLGRDKSSVTKCRKRLYIKIKGENGSADDMDSLIKYL